MYRLTLSDTFGDKMDEFICTFIFKGPAAGYPISKRNISSLQKLKQILRYGIPVVINNSILQ